MASPIVLTSAERLELTRRARRVVKAASDARRARLILLLADGMSWDEIRERLECSRGFIAIWCKRFVEQRIAGLRSRHMGRVASVLTPKMEARILKCRYVAPRGATRWTSRTLAEHLHISHMTVARVWRQHGEESRRNGQQHGSTKPGTATEAVDILALYLNPSAHAAVFCVLGDAAMKTRGAKAPVRSRFKTDGKDDKARGVRALYDILATKPGASNETSADPHSAAVFEAFLAEIVVNQPSSHEIHMIVDNFSLQENKQAREFLSAQKKVRLHSMTSYSSWLKQVELWISKIARDGFDRHEFTAGPVIRRRLMNQIRFYNNSRLTLRWRS